MPNVRVVLLKAIEPDAFVFYTQLRKRQGRGSSRPTPRRPSRCNWKSLKRQVRARGAVERRRRRTRGRLLQKPCPAKPAGGLGLAPVAPAGVARGPHGRRRTGGCAARTEPGASAALGRVPARSDGNRVLGRRGVPASRPLPLAARRAGLTLACGASVALRRGPPRRKSERSVRYSLRPGGQTDRIVEKDRPKAGG